MGIFSVITRSLLPFAIGCLVGRWAFSQGWGGAATFALATLSAPVLVGCLMPRSPIVPALALNLGAFAGVATTSMLWAVDHGTDLARELRNGWPVWALTAGWSIMTAMLSLFGKGLRWVFSAPTERASKAAGDEHAARQ